MKFMSVSYPGLFGNDVFSSLPARDCIMYSTVSFGSVLGVWLMTWWSRDRVAVREPASGLPNLKGSACLGAGLRLQKST